MMYCWASLSFIFQLHILLPGALSMVLKLLADPSKPISCGSPAIVGDIVKQVRAVQLVVNLFHPEHQNIMYCMKLVLITAATVNGYGAISHGKENVVYFLLTSCITCDTIFLYAFVYEKAFAIPNGLERVKRTLTAKIQMVRGIRSKRALRRDNESIPVVGLKIGDFHMLEM